MEVVHPKKRRFIKIFQAFVCVTFWPWRQQNQRNGGKGGLELKRERGWALILI